MTESTVLMFLKNVSRAWIIVGIHCIFAEGEMNRLRIRNLFLYTILESMIMFMIISSGCVYLFRGTHGKFKWLLCVFFSLSEKRCSERCRLFSLTPWRM